MTTIRVLSAEGEETVWPRAAAAQQAATLKYWIDDGSADDGCAFDTRTPEVAGSGVPAQTLRAARRVFADRCDAGAAVSGGLVPALGDPGSRDSTDTATQTP